MRENITRGLSTRGGVWVRTRLVGCLPGVGVSENTTNGLSTRNAYPCLLTTTPRCSHYTIHPFVLTIQYTTLHPFLA